MFEVLWPPTKGGMQPEEITIAEWLRDHGYDLPIYYYGFGERFLAVPTGDGDPLCARVFKVVSDPYVGKLSYLRIFSGSLETNGSFVNPHSGKPEKAGKIVYCQGSEQTGCDKATAGDIAKKVAPTVNTVVLTCRMSLAP